MLVFLIGMMGSGKTTLGQELAQQLSYTFIDLDAYIEQTEQASIASIFEEKGPEAFRVLERAALEAVVGSYTDAVIATGGGAPCFFDNMAYMDLHGDTVFLDVPAQEITKRLLATDLSKRPLLANKSESEIISFLSKTLAERMQFYERAKYRIYGEVISALQLKDVLNYY